MHKVEGHEGRSRGTNTQQNNVEIQETAEARQTFSINNPPSVRDGTVHNKTQNSNTVRTGDSGETNSNMLIYRYFLRN